MIKAKNVNISDKEIALLDVVNVLGPCTSEQVHEAMDGKSEFLSVMRSLHNLVQKGFLQRVIVNKKQFYRTSRNYTSIKNLLKA